MAGDWDGNGKDEVAVFRGGNWSVRSDTTGTPSNTNFVLGSGTWPGTVPLAGDWDGDGVAGVGTFVPSTGGLLLRETASAALPTTPFLS